MYFEFSMDIYIYCDTCKNETPHEMIRKERNLYKCKLCGTYTSVQPENEVKIRAIISTGSRSQRGLVRLKNHEKVAVGSELIVDTNEGHKIGEVTSIELKNGNRVDSSDVKDVATIWLRDVGEVEVKFSLHKGSITSPLKMVVDGETEFTVGELLNINGKPFKIHRIKLIRGGVLREERSKARAKEIRRIYAKCIK